MNLSVISYYDCAALIITLVVLIIRLSQRSFSSSSGKLYIDLLTSNALLCVFEILSLNLLPQESIPDFVKYVVHIPNLVLYVMLSFLMYNYTLDYLGGQDLLSRVWRIPHFVGLIIIFFIVTNPVHHLVFKFVPAMEKEGVGFAEKLGYSFGPFYYLLYIYAALVAMMMYAIIFLKRKKLLKIQLLTVSYGLIFEIVAVLVQMLVLGQFVIPLFVAVLCIIYYAAFEDKTIYYVEGTGCFNSYAFYTLDRDRAGSTGRYISVVGMENNDFARTMFSPENEKKMVKLVHEFMSVHFGKENVFYYGDFRFVITSDRLIPLNANAFREALPKTLELGSGAISFSPYICLIDRNDYSNEDDIRYAIDVIAADSENNYTDDIKVITKDELEKREHEVRIAQALRAGISKKRFKVHFQPIFDTELGRFKRAEALVRLTDPELGELYPDEFIPIAEKRGLIVPIGEIVFEEVCKFWYNNDPHIYGLETIEINLSTVQCSHKNLISKMQKIMDKYNMDPSNINLQITENVLVSNEKAILYTIGKLNEMGFPISLDGFGTGVSNINYLAKLKLRNVKMGRRLVWNAVRNEKYMTILKNYANVVQQLGIPCVMEGVETEEMREKIEPLGCRYVQGYLYSKPLSEGDFIDFIILNA